jgi:hypothetical protein
MVPFLLIFDADIIASGVPAPEQAEAQRSNH